MKCKLSILIMIFLFLSGCVTLPPPVDEAYLTEMTDEESAKLDEIGADIIAKKKDKDKIEKELEIIAQRTQVSSKEVSGLEAESEVLLEKEKLYSMDGDSRFAEVQDQKKKNELKLAQARAMLDYNTAKQDETGALLEVKKSELAVRVAELDYEKALIAKTYQLKRVEEFEEDMIDESEYKKFMDDQKVKLEENQKKYREALQALTQAEAKLKNSGHEGEK